MMSDMARIMARGKVTVDWFHGGEVLIDFILSLYRPVTRTKRSKSNLNDSSLL